MRSECHFRNTVNYIVLTDWLDDLHCHIVTWASLDYRVIIDLKGDNFLTKVGRVRQKHDGSTNRLPFSISNRLT